MADACKAGGSPNHSNNRGKHPDVIAGNHVGDAESDR